MLSAQAPAPDHGGAANAHDQSASPMSTITAARSSSAARVQSTPGLATASSFMARRWAVCSRSPSPFCTGGSAISARACLHCCSPSPRSSRIYYVPSLKYAANPPAVGEPDTITYRTGLYLLMMLTSLGGIVFAVALGTAARRAYGGLNATLIGAGVYIAIIVIAQLVLPDINEVPADFPACVLWKFRMASLGMQAVTWGVLGVVFGALADRLLHPAFAPRAQRTA